MESLGAFNPGPQPSGTHIIGEISHVGYPAIQTLWKNAEGRFVSSCCDKYSRRNHATTPRDHDSNEIDPSQLDGKGYNALLYLIHSAYFYVTIFSED